MTHMHLARVLPVLGLVMGLAQGCGGCGQKPAACQSDTDCTDGKTCSSGECQPHGASSSSSSGGVGQYCDADNPCPTDFTCVTEVNLCVSKHACDTAAECMPGQECRDFNGDGYRDCGYPGCNSDAECVGMVGTCATGTRATCYLRACVCRSPCGSDCGTGKVCCGVTGGECGTMAGCCINDPGPCPDLTCQPGYEPSPSGTPAWTVDLCQYNASTCTCTEKPPLPLGVMGDPSAIGVDAQGRLWAAAYNYGPYGAEVPATAPYGDLMVGLYNASHTAFDWTFVDGVPLGAPVEGGPSGPRGGVSESGPDMGRYLDMAVSGTGVVHVVYQDRTNGTLRYARMDGTNITKFALDPQRETGVYPSVALDPTSGAPRVAWLTRRDTTSGSPKGILKFAAANNDAPGASSDFVYHSLAETDLTTLDCEGGCPASQKCEAVTSGVAPCVTPTTGCASCGMGKFCLNNVCVSEVAGSNLLDVPQGPGVFSSMVVRTDGKPVVAVFDSVAGALKVYSTMGGDPPNSPAARFDILTVSTPGQVVGRWPRVALDPSGQVKVAFINDTTHALELVTLGASLSLVSRETVDDAARTNGSASDLHRLANPALVVRGDGAEVVAYQDGTTGELLLASRSGGSFTRSTLAGGGTPYVGSFGFSTDAVARGNGAPVISTFKHNPHGSPPEDGLVLFNWP